MGKNVTKGEGFGTQTIISTKYEPKVQKVNISVLRPSTAIKNG